ncbi:MAG: FAD binding domain-containing protein [Polaromonas sp.]
MTDQKTHPIKFYKGGQTVTLANVPPSRTLLDVLREDLCSTATKEGCGEGDCGACTVVLGEKQGDAMTYKAVNSCIRLAHSVNGMAIWTAEDIAVADGSLHPVQEAMVQCHASQCGFCTPGFVMSLFAMYQNHTCKGHAITRELAKAELSGNLCRCTGYRPILDAAQMLDALPVVLLDETDLLQKLELLAPVSIGLEADLSHKNGYKSPLSLKSLLKTRAALPNSQIVAGATDVGLWINKQHRQFDQIIDVTKVAELRRIEDYPNHIAIGAAVTLNDAFAALSKDRPQLHDFAARFAGLPVRNSGTLGGNVANGSPIGDSMPLLIALGANVVLMSVRGSRDMPLERLYTGYRQNVMAPDEVLAWIKVPKPWSPHPNPPPEGEGTGDMSLTPSPPGGRQGWGLCEFLRIYKISKRFDDDISAICLAINLHLDNGIVIKASIGVGGVAATPVRAIKTEAACARQYWSEATIDHIKTVLRAEFSPISDMRASSAYRTQVLGNLLERFWLESQGMQQINLESFKLGSQ